jgi:hypothetical protein
VRLGQRQHDGGFHSPSCATKAHFTRDARPLTGVRRLCTIRMTITGVSESTIYIRPDEPPICRGRAVLCPDCATEVVEVSQAQAGDCRALTQGRIVPGRHGISACRRCPASRTRLSRGYAGVCCVRPIDGSSAVPLPKLAVSTTVLLRGAREHQRATDRRSPDHLARQRQLKIVSARRGLHPIVQLGGSSEAAASPRHTEPFADNTRSVTGDLSKDGRACNEVSVWNTVGRHAADRECPLVCTLARMSRRKACLPPRETSEFKLPSLRLKNPKCTRTPTPPRRDEEAARWLPECLLSEQRVATSRTDERTPRGCRKKNRMADGKLRAAALQSSPLTRRFIACRPVPVMASC